MRNRIFRNIIMLALLLSLAAGIGALAAGCADNEEPQDPVQIILEAADEFHFYYDGQPHSISYSVNPEDAVVTFTVNGAQGENSFTEVGEYSVNVAAQKEGYVSASKDVKVVIEKQSAQINTEETQLYYYQSGRRYYFIPDIVPDGAEYTVTIKETGETAPQAFTSPGKYNLIVHVEGNE